MLIMIGGVKLAFAIVTFLFSAYFTRIYVHFDVAILELPPVTR